MPSGSTTKAASVDIAVIGAGIAGMSAAHFLAHRLTDASIGIFEAEATMTHHTTGRSAAVFIENYGAESLRPLTLASKPFYLEPPSDLAAGPLLTLRGYLAIAAPGDESQIDALVAEGRRINPDIGPIEISEALSLAPLLRPDRVAAALYEPGASAIDVAGLHQAFVRGFRSTGGSIHLTTRVDAARPQGSGWVIDTTNGPVAAGLIVNAAGAWGDVVAASAAVTPIGLEPKRRTAFMVRSPYTGSSGWPLVAEAAHRWYTNPDGDQFLCSPADETPSEPNDAKPEELDIALAIDRINAATTLDIRSITSSWAGLRTFSPDRGMVIGPDPEHPRFFWVVGQGGTGIQTAPGAGRLVADLVADGEPGSLFTGTGLDLSGLLPDRLR